MSNKKKNTHTCSDDVFRHQFGLTFVGDVDVAKFGIGGRAGGTQRCAVNG